MKDEKREKRRKQYILNDICDEIIRLNASLRNPNHPNKPRSFILWLPR